jgi:GlpG protein
MRQAGTIATRQDAERFANYLLSLGITSKIDAAGGQWAIWVHDENELGRSRQELAQFHEQPHDPRYQEAEHAAKLARREAAEKMRQARRNYVDMRNEWASPWRRRPVTVALMAASILVALGAFGLDEQELLFSTAGGSMHEIASGQVWRLVTPIFLHGGVLHLLFNMFWLYDLGTLVERRLGTVLYALLVLAIAVPSNFGQFAMVGPNFGGMSGVVYGLFGYAWVRGRLDPSCGLYLRPDIAFWMMAWFVLCLVTPSLHVANWAHGVGLAVGAALGYLAHVMPPLRRRKNT